MVIMVKEETRKGPWTEQEDIQLIFFVGLFGDRRWDAIAKASGLHRTGKSCRLRWVNYLRPGLKRGRMTPQEERLILDLHSRWGNRWSRIARRLPGRTDNEIKNYWRTHTRKKVQARKRGSSPALSASSSSSCLLDELPRVDAGIEKSEPHDAGRPPTTAPWEGEHENVVCGFPMMEQIWNEIASSEMSGLTCYEEYIDEACNQLPCSPVLASQPWDYSCVDSLWKMDDEELKMLLPPGDHANSSSHQNVIRELP